MEKGRGWGVLLVSCECCCDWIVSGGHDPRMGCHWASRAPPRPGPSFPSNSPLPSHTTHKCTCTHKIDTHTYTHPHLIHPHASHCASTPLHPLLHCFSTCLRLCVFFSPPTSVTCPPMASGGSAGASTLKPGWSSWIRRESEETRTANSRTSAGETERLTESHATHFTIKSRV